MADMTADEYFEYLNSLEYGVYDHTPIGVFAIARGLTRKEAGELIFKLENEAKKKGEYFEDRFTMFYYPKR